MTQNCVIFLISSLYPFFSGPHSLPDDQNGHCCLLLLNIKIILFVSLSPTHSKAIWNRESFQWYWDDVTIHWRGSHIIILIYENCHKTHFSDFENSFSWVLSFILITQKFEIWVMETKTENSTKHYFSKWISWILSFEFKIFELYN